MIDPIGTPSAALPAPAPTPSSTSGEGGDGFDAALKAAREAAARAEARDNEREAIVEKGFSAWVRDTKMEQLKEKLRRLVMAEMGVDAESLSRLDATMRQILEQKIEAEVQRRMAEASQEGDGAKGADQPGKKDRVAGNSCPLVPTLAWPGGASLF